MLNVMDMTGMSQKRVRKLKVPIEDMNETIASLRNKKLTPPTRAANDVPSKLLSTRRRLLLKELEFPPLIHYISVCVCVCVCVYSVSKSVCLCF